MYGEMITMFNEAFSQTSKKAKPKTNNTKNKKSII